MKNKKLILIILAFALLCVGCTAGREHENSGSTAGDSAATKVPSVETEIQTGTEPDGESDAALTEKPSSPMAGDVPYTLKFVDQKGWAIEGVVVKVCNADACVMGVSDESGLCELTLPASTYEVQLLNIPEGYEVTGDSTCTVAATDGELVITLKRNWISE